MIGFMLFMCGNMIYGMFKVGFYVTIDIYSYLFCCVNFNEYFYISNETCAILFEKADKMWCEGRKLRNLKNVC